MSEKPPHYPDAANVDVVTAAIPLLQSHVLQAGEKLPIVEPPEYTEVDILDSKEATTEGNDGEEEEDHWRMPELEDSGPSWSGGYIRIHVETPGRGGGGGERERGRGVGGRVTALNAHSATTLHSISESNMQLDVVRSTGNGANRYAPDCAVTQPAFPKR